MASDGRSLPVPRPNRIAVTIAKAAQGPIIVRTVQELSYAGGAAPSTFRSWCCAANIKPHYAVAFARALGAIYHGALDRVDPTDLLDFADKRSLDRFLAKSGPLARDGQAVPVAVLCSQQQFIKHPPILTDVIRLVSA